MSSSLSPSGLIVHDYTDANWQVDLLSNVTRLNSTLLYLNNMGDVSMSGLLNGDVLKWDGVLSKYVNTKRYITTTTTTSTTTTTTITV